MLADCRSALMAVFVVDEAPLLLWSSMATTATVICKVPVAVPHTRIWEDLTPAYV